MSSSPSALRTLAFGDLERGIWGAAWVPVGNGPGLTALGDGSAVGFASDLRLVVDQDAGEWLLEGGGAALTVVAVGDDVAVGRNDDRVEGFDQLCRVSGRFSLGGAEVEVECLGLRTSRSGGFDLGKLESVRAVSTWFEPDEGLAVMAFRARKAKAHDGDVVTAAVLGPETSAAVEDPRLSTTYDAGGWPLRAGLELWVAHDDDEEEQYPRRASGEATGARAETADGALELRAEPFRWHSRGRDGAGMYILARRR
ncbi:MAG TPA: hypothetical protein VMB27_06625 [Solirubrobacteraceae bacterium]|nr:hypothetical protein [Solirubrobacteraceae bacterium]